MAKFNLFPSNLYSERRVVGRSPKVMDAPELGLFQKLLPKTSRILWEI